MEELRGKEGEDVIDLLLKTKVCLHSMKRGGVVMHRVFKGQWNSHCSLRHHPEMNLQARNPFCSTFSSATLLL